MRILDWLASFVPRRLDPIRCHCCGQNCFSSMGSRDGPDGARYFCSVECLDLWRQAIGEKP